MTTINTTTPRHSDSRSADLTLFSSLPFPAQLFAVVCVLLACGVAFLAGKMHEREGIDYYSRDAHVGNRFIIAGFRVIDPDGYEVKWFDDVDFHDEYGASYEGKVVSISLP